MILIRWLLLAVFALAIRLGQADPLRIVVTMPAIYSWTAQVVGTNAVVESLLPGETGVHHYRLKPQDLRRLTSADLLVIIGLGVDDWVAKAAEKERGNGLRPRIARLSSGMDSQLIREENSAEPNPHIWLDPVLVEGCLSNLVAVLSELDPKSSSQFVAHAEAYRHQLRRLDDDLRQGVAKLGSTNLVTFHDAFPYFARRYGLKMLGIVEEQPNVDPSPRHLAQVSHTIREAHVPVIFTEPQYSPRLAQRIAADLGIKVAVLDVLETGEATPSFYEQAMRRNLQVLQESLR